MNELNNILNFDESTVNLPINNIIPTVVDKLSKSNRLIISAPPGSGKSTILPIIFAREITGNRNVLMLEPRRVAAISIARRMSDLLNEPLGQHVGYSVRFDHRYSDDTCIHVLTEGLLSRLLLNDPDLHSTSVVIFDEFHERSIHADEALALTLKCQEILRPDLKIIIMSASVHDKKISDALHCPVVKASDQPHPLHITNINDIVIDKLPYHAQSVARDAMSHCPGDCLIFLPGKREIDECYDLLLPFVKDKYHVFKLHGSLSQDEQQQALQPSSDNRRKIIISTNLAETSLTIEGVRIVVDGGLYRHVQYNHRTCLTELVTSRISLDMALQRAGRAARLGEGWCYRLYSKADEARMHQHRTPEILESDLSNLVLDIALYGAAPFFEHLWLDPPAAGDVAASVDLLKLLGALNPDGSTNLLSSMLAKFPCHPRIASMLSSASTNEERSVASDLAACIEDSRSFQHLNTTDLALHIEALRNSRSRRFDTYKYIVPNKAAEQYRRLLNIRLDNNQFDPSIVGRLLVRAYPERIAQAVEGSHSKFILTNGSIASLPPHDSLEGQQFIVIASIDGNRQSSRILSAASVDPKDFSHLVRVTRNISWSEPEQRILCRREERLGRILLSTTNLDDATRSEIDPILLKEISLHGPKLLKFDDSYERFQYRVESLRLWRPELHLPDPSPAAFCSHADELFAPFISDCLTANHLKRLDPADIFYHWLLFESKQALDHYAPNYLITPAGTKSQLLYQRGGQPPIWQVRIQEVFGLLDTPAVDEGRHPVVIHLLSPGRRPVQVTQNLCSFWYETYPKIRGELQARYPKHPWPVDPFSVPPTRILGRPKKK